MEEKDVIPDRTLSNDFSLSIFQSCGGTDLLIYGMWLYRHERDLRDLLKVEYLAPPIMADQMAHGKPSFPVIHLILHSTFPTCLPYA